MDYKESIASLTEQLILTATVPSSKDASRIHQLQLTALRIFADPHPARTNPFDVNAQLAGLEEKFRVLNNEELADALQSRLRELSRKSDKWAPEVLSLLLQLSDQPATKSKIEDLALFKPDPLPVPLTWSEILADDPLDNRDGLWDEVDFAADGSDDDDDEDDILLDKPSTVDSPPDAESEERGSNFNADELTVPVVDAALHDILDAQFWRNERVEVAGGGQYSIHPPIYVSEAQAIREVIFMLLGLPTSIYNSNKDEIFSISSSYKIRHLSQTSTTHLLHRFTLLGNDLVMIRRWLKREETVPLMQTFQAALASRLGEVDSALSAQQAKMLASSVSFTSSLLSLFDEASHITGSMQQVAKILVRVDSSPKVQMPFRILELLYDATCANQSIGDTKGYKFMAKLFFDCFDTYLKPVRHWMENGALSRHAQSFFVNERREQVSPSSVWERQYHLIKDDDCNLYVPKFLHVGVKKIFTTGKSVNFLKSLRQETGNLKVESREEPAVDYESVCIKNNPSTLSPFSELFDKALDSWIASKHHSSSRILRQCLENQCGLGKSLDALENLYFFRNGTLSVNITRSIFDRMDRGMEAWNDGFLLTELFQNIFSALACVDIGCLAVRPSAGSYQDIQSKRRSMRILGSISLRYTLPWPVANIIKQESILIYQRIFVFLLQVKRAKHILERQRLLKSALPAPKNADGENHLVYSLRHRLLWFSNVLLTYLTEIVLFTATAEMRASMAAAEDVDEMIAAHEIYVSKLEKQCLIDKRLAPIQEAIISLLDLVILFSDAHAFYTGQKTLDFLNGSAVLSVRHKKVSSNRNRSSDQGSESSDDDKEAAPNNQVADVSYMTFNEMSYAGTLLKMHAKFAELLDFVIAGLLGVHRVGGESCWEILAESLGIGIRRQQKHTAMKR
ncbi:hypothetical protein MMC07_005800 [Pseudocyphellaria aurata]|nr:hypothetical protein [Pseudocyphellaria aurata]